MTLHPDHRVGLNGGCFATQLGGRRINSLADQDVTPEGSQIWREAFFPSCTARNKQDSGRMWSTGIAMPRRAERGSLLRLRVRQTCRSPGSGDDLRFEFHAMPWHTTQHIKCNRQTVSERSYSPEAELLGGTTRVPDRDPHLAGARRPVICDELGPV